MSDPVHYTVPTYLGTVAAGTVFLAVGLDILVIEPGRVPRRVTPTGLVPVRVVFDDEFQQADS